MRDERTLNVGLSRRDVEQKAFSAGGFVRPAPERPRTKEPLGALMPGGSLGRLRD